MKVAICDPDAFYPLRDLVSGPFHSLDDLAAIERFVRTVVLHDEMVMELTPWPYDPDVDFEFTEEEKQAGGRNVITAIGPVLTDFEFFAERNWRPPVPDIKLSPSLVEIASKFANAGDGNVFFKAHVEHLKLVLGVVEQGGSALMCGDFGQEALTRASEYPDALFAPLDEDWQRYVKSAQQDGLGLLVPPVLGIVLTRCGRRDAIPTVIKDLRDEWADSRGKVWEMLDSLRVCRTLGEAIEIRRGLSAASRLFSPEETELHSRPIRILLELLAAPFAGVLVAEVAGGDPLKGAMTNTITQLARSVPGFLHEFGSALFARGAFDLAKKVKRAAAEVEFDALKRLLTHEEKGKLGFG